jgi:hypothetical protein
MLMVIILELLNLNYEQLWGSFLDTVKSCAQAEAVNLAFKGKIGSGIICNDKENLALDNI